MTDESRADQLYAQLRDLALPWEEGHSLAIACAAEAVRGMRAAFNACVESNPYDADKPESWDVSSAPGENDPAVQIMAGIFIRILNRRGLLKIDPADGHGAGL